MTGFFIGLRQAAYFSSACAFATTLSTVKPNSANSCSAGGTGF
ncbi:hypothetical protein [Serratia bockelmannii]